MHLTVELIRQVPCALRKPFIAKVVQETLALSGHGFLEQKSVSVNIVFVSAEAIQALNKTYRRKNKVTDVLSFPEYANKGAMSEEAASDIFLGELILCYDYIDRAAREDEVSLEQETAYIVSHGILHLLGFRHSPKMFSLQDTVSEAYARR